MLEADGHPWTIGDAWWRFHGSGASSHSWKAHSRSSTRHLTIQVQPVTAVLHTCVVENEALANQGSLSSPQILFLEFSSTHARLQRSPVRFAYTGYHMSHKAITNAVTANPHHSEFYEEACIGLFLLLSLLDDLGPLAPVVDLLAVGR